MMIPEHSFDFTFLKRTFAKKICMCLYLYTSIFTYNCQSLKGWGLYLCPSPPPDNPHRKDFFFKFLFCLKNQSNQKDYSSSSHAGVLVNERGQFGKSRLRCSHVGEGISCLGLGLLVLKVTVLVKEKPG